MSEFIQNGEKDKFDTRKKLEADVRWYMGHFFAWDETREEFVCYVLEWLNRQAAITRAECEAALIVVDWWTDEHGDTHAIAANGEEVCHYVKGEHAEAVNREIEELRDKIDRLGIALTAALKTGTRLLSENNELRELLGSDAE